MSLIMGALAGAGEAGEKYFLQQQRSNDAGMLERMRSDLTMDREKALQVFKEGRAEDARLRTQADIAQARSGLVAGALDKKYADATPADPATWTPEMQAAVNQSRALDQASLNADPRVNARAALVSGHLPEAAQYDKIADSGLKTVTPYSALVDSDGNELYLNDGYGKHLDAMAEKAATSKGKQPMDPTKVMQIVDQVGSKTSLPPNPFVDPASRDPNTGKVPTDESGRSAFNGLFGAYLTQTNGEQPLVQLNKAKTEYTAINRIVADQVNREFNGLFDAKGRFNSDDKTAAAIEQKYGVNPKSAGMFATKAAARDAALERAVSYRLDRLGGASASNGDGTPPQSTSSPSAAPAPVVAPTPSPTPAPAAKPAPAAAVVEKPTYEKWLQAKEELDTVLKNASRMSPDAADMYLRSRRADLEKRIKFNENYPRY